MAQVDEQTGLVAAPVTITESNSDVTAVADSTASVWSNVFYYKVPLGVAIELAPQNYFYIDWKDTAGNDHTNTGSFKLTKSNANNTEEREIISGPNTLFGGNIYDRQEQPRFKMPVTLNASQRLNIWINSALVADSGNTLFSIEGTQYYERV